MATKHYYVMTVDGIGDYNVYELLLQMPFRRAFDIVRRGEEISEDYAWIFKHVTVRRVDCDSVSAKEEELKLLREDESRRNFYDGMGTTKVYYDGDDVDNEIKDDERLHCMLQWLGMTQEQVDKRILSERHGRNIKAIRAQK
jgi:hypothetical protein